MLHRGIRALHRSATMRPHRYQISVALFWGILCMLDTAPAFALPVFARVYDKAGNMAESNKVKVFIGVKKQ